MDCSIRYWLKNKLLDITTYSTVLSVGGGFLVASNERFIREVGYIIWIISNVIWCYHFGNTKQTNAMIMFFIYLITSIIGLYNNLV